MASLVVFGSLTSFFYFKGVVRVSPEHMLISCVPAIIMLAFLLDAILPKSFAKGTSVVALAAVAPILLVPGFALALAAYDRSIVATIVTHTADPNTARVPSLSFYQARPAAIEAAVYVRSVTSPAERILSATGRHDKIFVNDVSFYFLAERLPATRWHQYDPGVQTTERVQGEIIHDLKWHGVRYVVLDESFATISLKATTVPSVVALPPWTIIFDSIIARSGCSGQFPCGV